MDGNGKKLKNRPKASIHIKNAIFDSAFMAERGKSLRCATNERRLAEASVAINRRSALVSSSTE